MMRPIRIHTFAPAVLAIVITLSFAAPARSATQPASTTIEGMIAIDAKETSEPISPYLYGQFIEHLGRCIYGGIWA